MGHKRDLAEHTALDGRVKPGHDVGGFWGTLVFVELSVVYGSSSVSQ